MSDKETQVDESQLLLSWDFFFMGVACLTSERSPDENTKVGEEGSEYLRKGLLINTSGWCEFQVGACIVNKDKRIIATGFNDRLFPSVQDEKLKGKDKYAYISYAIPSAILGHAYGALLGSCVYVTHFPSYQCAQLMIQSGVKKVYYLSDKFEGYDKENEAAMPKDVSQAPASKKSKQSEPSKDELEVAMPKDVSQAPASKKSKQSEPSKRELEAARATRTMLLQAGVATMKLMPDKERQGFTIKFNEIDKDRDTKLNCDYPSSGEVEVWSEGGDDNHFMSLAFLASRRSKDPATQVGAVIVRDVCGSKRLIGIGYNGMPDGNDLLPWDKDKEKPADRRKDNFVCHAELNAIVNSIDSDFGSCRMYVCMFPCLPCAKLIIRAGIKEFVYYSEKKRNHEESAKAEELLMSAHVRYRRYVPVTSDKDAVDIQFKDFLTDYEDQESLSRSYLYF